MDLYAVFQVAQLLLRLLIYTFIGQGLLAVLVGPRHRDNPVWRLFDTVTRPVWRLVRAGAPRFVPDRAVAWLAVALLVALNLALYMFFHSRGWLVPPAAGTAG